MDWSSIPEAPLGQYSAHLVECWFGDDPRKQFIETYVTHTELTELLEWCDRHTSAGHGSLIVTPVPDRVNTWCVGVNPDAEDA